MQQLGNLNLVGFKVGGLTGAPGAPPLYRDCQIYIGGDCVSDCKREYLPDLTGDINGEIERIRNRLDFLKHEDELLRFDNLTEIHNAFMAYWRGEPNFDETAYTIGMHCAFLTWCGPLTTDLFRAFIVPFRGQLWLTWQKWVNHEIGFKKLDVVNYLPVNPFDLVDNFRECVETLRNAG